MSFYLPPWTSSGRDAELRFDVWEAAARGERRRALRAPRDIYRSDRRWTPSLLRDDPRMLDPAHNPMLMYSMHALYLAEARDLSLGAILGSVAVWAEREATTGCFGMFEVINRPEVAEALFFAAEAWLLENASGLTTVRGPMSLSPLGPPGLLVDGFDVPPAAFLAYNPPYYPDMVLAAGYAPAQSWQAYAVDLGRAASAALGAATWTIRVAAASDAPALVSVAAALYAAAGQGDASEEMISAPDQLSAGLAGLLSGDSAVRLGPERRLAVHGLRRRTIAAVVEAGGQPLGAILGAPDISAALRLVHGHLLPVGWLPYALSVQRTRRLRILPAAVMPAGDGLGLELALYRAVIAAAARRGFATAIIGPLRVGDKVSAQAMAALGARVIQTYQVYEKTF